MCGIIPSHSHDRTLHLRYYFIACSLGAIQPLYDPAWPQALSRESLRTPNNHDVVIMTYARELCGSDTYDT